MRSKKGESFSYFCLAFLLFMVLNLPTSFSKGIRGPILGFEDLFASSHNDPMKVAVDELKAENSYLKEQLQLVQEDLASQNRLTKILEQIESYEGKGVKKYKEFYKRRATDLAEQFKYKKYALTAKVIFREPALWSSALWVDRGEEDNRRAGFTLISVDSPVLVGDTLVGVVEEVQESKSRIRLITDARLTPSVRCIRGADSNVALSMQLAETISHMRAVGSGQELISPMEALSEKLAGELEGTYLAKGELRGSSYPLWRSRSNVLKGIGFNYDFADGEGKERPLHESQEVQLLRKGDLLVTTGFDGVFPRGLRVAYVTKVFPLREGAVAFEIQARSILGNLDSLTHVQILPKL